MSIATFQRLARPSYLDWSVKGKAGFIRYLLGSLLLTICFFVIGSLAILPLAMLVPDFQSSPVLKTLSIFLPFSVPFFFIPLTVRLLHGRPSWSVAMPEPWFGVADFVTGLWIGGVVGLVATIGAHLTDILPVTRNPQFTLGEILPLIFLGFVGIFIQAGAEALLFRGYFMQFVKRFTANKFLIVGIPALLFAVPHIGNIASLGTGWVVLLPYLTSGILFGWVACWTGSLWMSLGLHLINNYASLVLLGAKGDVLAGNAPFLVEAYSLAAITALTALQAVLSLAILAILPQWKPRGN